MELENVNKSPKTLSARIIKRKETSERRKGMRVKIITFNISSNHLSQNKKKYLDELSKEAKYFYNYMIYFCERSCVDDFGNIIYPNNLKNFDTKSNIIQVFDTLQTQFL